MPSCGGNPVWGRQRPRSRAGSRRVCTRSRGRKAEAAVETGDRDGTAAALAQLRDTAPPDAHFRAGVLLARAGKYLTAAAEFRRARGASVDAYQTAYNLVLTSLKAGQFRDAVEAA